jgi:hypothetical protein
MERMGSQTSKITYRRMGCDIWKKNNGRPVKYVPHEFVNALADLPLRSKMTIQSLSRLLGVSQGRSHHLIKLHCRQHSSVLKPVLTEENKVARVEHCLWHQDPERDNGVSREMHDVVHLDETCWYYLTRLVEHYYLTPHEADPERNTRHKSHIPKCMFLSAVGRPQYDYGRNQWFNGKLGLWPISHQVPAQQDSNNRPRGALEWKDLTRDKDCYTFYLIEQVIPRIMERWPRANRTIRLQQDNAKPHLSPEEFAEVYEENCEHLQRVFGGDLIWEILLFNQPANNPDLNLNDLAFFVSTKAQYWKDPALQVQ